MTIFTVECDLRARKSERQPLTLYHREVLPKSRARRVDPSTFIASSLRQRERRLVGRESPECGFHPEQVGPRSGDVAFVALIVQVHARDAKIRARSAAAGSLHR